MTINQIKALFENRAINNKGFCEICGLKVDYVNKILKGKKNLTPNIEQKLKAGAKATLKLLETLC